MAKKPTGPTAPYTVLRSSISHNGEDYAPGESIELTEAEAEALLGVAAISVLPAKEPKEPKQPKT